MINPNSISEIKKWLKANVIEQQLPSFVYEKLPDNQYIAYVDNTEKIKKCFGIAIRKISNTHFKVFGVNLRIRLNKFEDFYNSECQNYKITDEYIEVYTIGSKNKFEKIWPTGYSIDLISEEANELLLIKIKEYIKVYGYIFIKYKTLYDLHAECNIFGDNLSLYVPYGEHFKHIYIKYFCNDPSYKIFAELVIERKNKSINDYPVDSVDPYMLSWKREVVAIEDLLQRIERGELKHLIGTF